jgi:hypothetical protein
MSTVVMRMPKSAKHDIMNIRAFIFDPLNGVVQMPARQENPLKIPHL